LLCVNLFRFSIHSQQSVFTAPHRILNIATKTFTYAGNTATKRETVW